MMSFLEKDVDVKSGHSFTDPYSAGLSYFFKKVAFLDRDQLRLLSEFTDFPELRGVIKMEIDKNGDVLGFKIEDQEMYQNKKAELHLQP